MKPHTLKFLKGSPRDMLCSTEQKQTELGSELHIQLISYPKLEALSALVPQNNMVGENDIIPGLKEERLKNLKLDLSSAQTAVKAGLVA